MNEPDPSRNVLDYATTSKWGAGMPFLSNSQARMISASVVFVGATVLGSHQDKDTVILGVLLGLLALAAFALEYVRSWRGGGAAR